LALFFCRKISYFAVGLFLINFLVGCDDASSKFQNVPTYLTSPTPEEKPLPSVSDAKFSSIHAYVLKGPDDKSMCWGQDLSNCSCFLVAPRFYTTVSIRSFKWKKDLLPLYARIQLVANSVNEPVGSTTTFEQSESWYHPTFNKNADVQDYVVSTQGFDATDEGYLQTSLYRPEPSEMDISVYVSGSQEMKTSVKIPRKARTQCSDPHESYEVVVILE
jgi:hypothetical protein